MNEVLSMREINTRIDLIDEILKIDPKVDPGFLSSLNLVQLEKYKSDLAKDVAEKYYGPAVV